MNSAGRLLYGQRRKLKTMERTEVPNAITLAQALARLEKRILQNAKNSQRQGMI